MTAAGHFAIAGVGNELLTDDGFGVHVVRELQETPLPGVGMFEIGTAILHGLSCLEGAQRVLVIDAVRGGRAPGTIYQFDAATSATLPPGASIHALGLREALRFLPPGCSRPTVTVLGVEPASLAYGLDLSAVVQAAVPRVVELARSIVTEWQSSASGHHPVGTDAFHCVPLLATSIGDAVVSVPTNAPTPLLLRSPFPHAPSHGAFA